VVGDMRLISVLILLALIAITAVAASKEPLRTIPAEDILSKIKLGLPVEYDHVTIIGNLTLNDLGLPTRHVSRTPAEANLDLSENATVINSSIRLNDSIILGRAEFNNSIFQESVSFEGTKFQDSAYFKGTQFNDSVDFKDGQFSRFVDFRDARFRGSANLEGARFNESANFAGSEFSREMPLSRGFSFNEAADFLGTRYSEFSNFVRFKFNEATSFVESQLSGFVDFIQSGYHETASFMELQLIGFIDFIGPKYHETTVILESQLIEFAYFVISKYHETASFIKPQLSGFAGFIEFELNETVQFATWIFYKPGIMLKYLSTASAIVIIVFAFFWRAIGIKTPEKLADENILAEGQHDRRSSIRSSIMNKFLMLLEAPCFSMTVFLSGTKIFIDTPNIPDMQGRVKYLASGMFALERIIGAVIVILIFVAISKL
jgi:hypothetical protein